MALGDVKILNVDYPATLLPGEQAQVVVDVQFFKYLNNWYCRIWDNDIPGSIPFRDVEKLGSWDVGAFDDAAMNMRPQHFMPDRAWNLRVEVGVMNWLGGHVATDYIFVTIYPGSLPPVECPEGYYYDIVTEACVAYRKPVNWTPFLMIGAVGLFVVNFVFTKGKNT